MRETRYAHTSIFEFYAEHELGRQLREPTELLDDCPAMLTLIELDLRDADTCPYQILNLED